MAKEKKTMREWGNEAIAKGEIRSWPAYVAFKDACRGFHNFTDYELSDGTAKQVIKRCVADANSYQTTRDNLKAKGKKYYKSIGLDKTELKAGKVVRVK